MTGSKPLLARQPIYNEKMEVMAFELLFRSGETNAANFDDEDHATSEVILNAFTSLPVEELLEGKPAFINFTRKLLNAPPPIEKNMLVVEVLETVHIDRISTTAIKRLKQNGYTIALDDYIYNPKHEELLSLADIVKIDVMNHSMAEVAEQIELIKPYNVTFLAEKVETHEVFEACKELGFTRFQGYFLAKPQIVKGNKITSNQQSVLRLFTLLEDPDCEIPQVEEAVASDPVLTFKLLRLINSAYYNVGREIESVHKAITLLGLIKIKSLAALLTLGSLENKPRALHVSTLIRARMCQLIAEKLGYAEGDAESLFTAGLLSTLDAYLNMELEGILDSINLAEHLKEAILFYRDQVGLILAISVSFERCQFDQVHISKVNELGLDNDDLEDCYIQAVKWAGENVGFLV